MDFMQITIYKRSHIAIWLSQRWMDTRILTKYIVFYCGYHFVCVRIKEKREKNVFIECKLCLANFSRWKMFIPR